MHPLRFCAMVLGSLAKKLVRTLARVIPQCGMISQAVAFNMFLAFFPILLVALGLVSSFLGGERGQVLAVRLSAILPPGSWQLVSEFLLRHQVNAFRWVLLGWVGTLLVGSQVMKLIMEGIHLIYGDRERHSFLGRQLRGMLLFCVTIAGWVGAVVLSAFSNPLRRLDDSRIRPVPLGSWLLEHPASGCGVDSGDVRLGLDLSHCTTERNDLAVGFARSRRGDDSLVVLHFDVWSLRPKDGVWTYLRHPCGSDRLDGVDGTLCNDRLSRRRLERRKHSNGEFVMTKEEEGVVGGQLLLLRCFA